MMILNLKLRISPLGSVASSESSWRPAGFSVLRGYGMRTDIVNSAGGLVKILRHPEFDDVLWKRIPWAPGYYVHFDGFVKSVIVRTESRQRRRTVTERILALSTTDGYVAVNIGSEKDGTRRRITLHTLVASVFLGDRPEGLDVMHRDGDRMNPRASNLMYGTKKENEKMKMGHGTDGRGERNPAAKLTQAEANKVKDLLAQGVKGVIIADRFGITPTTVSYIKKGKTWR